MSLEDDFHKLIENQDKETKQRLWKKIELDIKDKEDAVETDGEVLVLSKGKNFFNKRNFLISLFVFLAFILALLLTINFTVWNPLGDKIIPDIGNRYCTINDYNSEEVTVNIGQYSAENNLNILHFNYEAYEPVVDTHYKLKDTAEVVCIQEELIALQETYIIMFVTDNKTDIDVVQSVLSYCDKNEAVSSVSVKYGGGVSSSYANFEYNGYHYYLNVMDAPTENYILELIESLLN